MYQYGNILGMDRPTPKSLVLDILSSVRGQSVPIAALVEASALFGLAENSLRVTATRLLAAGRIERDGRGRYRLSAPSLAVDEQVRAWRTRESRLRPWKRGWVGVHHRPSAREAQALSLLGFASFRPGLFLRPDNWKGGAMRVRADLLRLGLSDEALVHGIAELAPGDQADASALWDTAALLAGYAAAREALRAGERTLAHLPEAEAMVESFGLGGRVIRLLALDPLLPEELVPAAPRRALTRALRSYDEAGRRAWAGFMARHGAPHLRAPNHGANERALLPV